MFDHILIARVGWSDHRYQGEDNLVKINDADYERFNFKTAPDGRCYGWIAGWPPAQPIPRPWLVVFIARKNSTGPSYAIGYYENALLETGYRPSTTGDPVPYSVHTDARNAHIIPSKNRHLFPVPDAGPEQQHRPYIYARDVDEPAFSESWHEPWRINLARFAESLASGQIPSNPKPSRKRVVPAAHRLVERRSHMDTDGVGC